MIMGAAWVLVNFFKEGVVDPILEIGQYSW